MNERLRELFEQAHSRKPTMVIDHQTGQAVQATFRGEKMYRNEFDPEKFAELIVKNVCNIVLHYTDVDEGVAVAKKHFGVDE